MADPDLSPNRRFYGRPGSKSSGIWLVVALLVLVLVGGLFYAWSGSGGPNSTASNSLSGQAASSSGSTTTGAPAGTPPSQITGQSASPSSGSATTGSNAKR